MLLLLALPRVLVVSALASNAQQSSSVAAVMAPINALLAGVAAHDGAAVLAAIRREGKATIAVTQPDGTLVLRHPTWTEFVGGIKPGPERFEPRLKNPIVKIDGDIAMAWTPYTFLIDGKVHHCGVNHFDLIREQGIWKILNVTYTYRTVACPPSSASTNHM